MYDSIDMDSDMIRKLRMIYGFSLKRRIVSFLKSRVPDFSSCQNIGEKFKTALAVLAWFLIGTYILGCVLLNFRGTTEAFNGWFDFPGWLLYQALSHVKF